LGKGDGGAGLEEEKGVQRKTKWSTISPKRVLRKEKNNPS